MVGWIILVVWAMIATGAEGKRPWKITGLAPATPPHGLFRLWGQAKNPGPNAGFDDPEGWAHSAASDDGGDESYDVMDTSGPPEDTQGEPNSSTMEPHGGSGGAVPPPSAKRPSSVVISRGVFSSEVSSELGITGTPGPPPVARSAPVCSSEALLRGRLLLWCSGSLIWSTTHPAPVASPLPLPCLLLPLCVLASELTSELPAKAGACTGPAIADRRPSSATIRS
jgi:hypothetical protein